MYFNTCPAYVTPEVGTTLSPVDSVLIHKRHYFHYFHLISSHYHLLFHRACLYLNYLVDFLWRFHCGAPQLHRLITGVRSRVAIDNGDVMMWNGHHSANQSTRVSSNPAATRLLRLLPASLLTLCQLRRRAEARTAFVFLPPSSFFLIVLFLSNQHY